MLKHSFLGPRKANCFMLKKHHLQNKNNLMTLLAIPSMPTEYQPHICEINIYMH